MARFWKKINSTPFILLFCVMLIFIVFLLGKQFKTKHTIDKEVAELKNRADNLQKNNQELQEFISYFQTDSYKEKAAREQLSVKKPGEMVFSFSDQQANVTTTPGGSQSPQDLSNLGLAPKTPSNPVKWWQYFFVYKE